MGTPHEKRLLGRAEVCAILGIGPTMFWQLVGSGALRSIRVGNRRKVPVELIEQFLQDRLAAEDARGNHQCAHPK